MRSSDNEPEMPKVCAFCDKSSPLADGEHMLCKKNGVVDCGYTCRKFKYDPLKRVPHSPPPMTHLDPDELSID